MHPNSDFGCSIELPWLDALQRAVTRSKPFADQYHLLTTWFLRVGESSRGGVILLLPVWPDAWIVSDTTR